MPCRAEDTDMLRDSLVTVSTLHSPLEILKPQSIKNTNQLALKSVSQLPTSASRL